MNNQWRNILCHHDSRAALAVDYQQLLAQGLPPSVSWVSLFVDESMLCEKQCRCYNYSRSVYLHFFSTKMIQIIYHSLTWFQCVFSIVQNFMAKIRKELLMFLKICRKFRLNEFVTIVQLNSCYPLHFRLIRSPDPRRAQTPDGVT